MDFINTTITILGGPENYVQSLSVIVTMLMVILSFINIWFSRKDKQEANRANVVGYFRSKGLYLVFVVKNVGLTNAYNVSVSCDPMIENHKGFSFKEVFDKKIPTLHPEYEIGFAFGNGSEYLKKFRPNVPTYHLKIEFKDIYNKKHLNEFDISLENIGRAMYLGSTINSIDHSLEKIMDYSKDTKNHIKDISYYSRKTYEGLYEDIDEND